jgi:hypothetical protein
MNLLELIDELKVAHKEFGNLQVMILDEENGEYRSVTSTTIFKLTKKPHTAKFIVIEAI